MTFQNVDSPVSARAVHRGLPSFFRARCYTASRGGADGYFNVGRKLAASLARLTPDDIDEDDEWCSELEALADIVGRRNFNDDETIWAWFRAHYPRCMNLVPTRRKDQFIAGVRAAWENEGFGI